MLIMQSICKVTRDAAGGVVSVWPYTSIVNTVWSIFLFPNDEWPDTGNGMLKCIILNSGAYIAAMCALGLLAFAWIDIESIYYAHIVIFMSWQNAAPGTYEGQLHSDDLL